MTRGFPGIRPMAVPPLGQRLGRGSWGEPTDAQRASDPSRARVAALFPLNGVGEHGMPRGPESYVAAAKTAIAIGVEAVVPQVEADQYALLTEL